MPSDTRLAAVEEILSHHRMALVGMSKDPKHFSRALFKEMTKLGYQLVPVNPKASGEELEGCTVYGSVAEIPQPVEAALILTGADHSADAVREALDAGVRRIWLYRATGKGAVSDEALAMCAEARATVVPGECPLMFMHGAHWLHRLHGWGKKVAGNYPN